MNIRIGIGNDIHKLVNDRPLIIGGVTIPYEKGNLGHSDGDALLHSIIDALLGALALGDVGSHFPDNDMKYKDADSGLLLKIVVNICHKEGYEINNIDSTVILQKPKLAPYILKIRENIAQITNTDIDRISVKAKTNENIGAIGEGNAIATYAVASLTKKAQ